MCTCAAPAYVRLRWLVMAEAEGGVGSALQEMQWNQASDADGNWAGQAAASKRGALKSPRFGLLRSVSALFLTHAPPFANFHHQTLTRQKLTAGYVPAG